MRTTTSTAAAALAGAVLLSTAACAPLSGRTASAPASRSASATPSPAATADPLAGQDPGAVLRRAYEQIERAGTKEALVFATVGERKFQASVTVGSDGTCSGSVTTVLAGAAEIYLHRNGVLLVKGDKGFLEDHFKDRPADAAKQAVARAADRWVTLPDDEPSTARLIGLCTAGGAPAKAYSMDRTDIRREPDTWSDGRPVAVFTSTDANGSRITDHVLLTGAGPSLQRRQQTDDWVLYTAGRPEPFNRLPKPPELATPL
ncbi:hypothetical protein ABZ924_04885 [Streptomyces sp. NPDC046876]|uniref:hypothetical protein n=1 Tax=Streptomyces sp. NPDC046876 TaxID=3155616 RepID=UPI003409449B